MVSNVVNYVTMTSVITEHIHSGMCATLRRQDQGEHATVKLQDEGEK